MPSTYQLWLTDDVGTRLLELKNYAFISYSRSLLGLGTFNIGIPYKQFVTEISPYFEVDRRVEVWRSPDIGYPLRRENVYLLRKPRIYTRESDSVQILELFGRSPIDLLRRRVIIQAAGSIYTTKTGTIDDIMKQIVREQMLYNDALDENGAVDNTRAYPQTGFFVQENLSLGPSVSVEYADRNVLDVLNELRDMSFQKTKEDSANIRIGFDVTPSEQDAALRFILEEDYDIILDEDGILLEAEDSAAVYSKNGFRFITYANLYGLDRTKGTVFSVENNNLRAPFYSKDHLEEVNTVIVKGLGRGDSRSVSIVQDQERVYSSRWNRCESFLDAGNEPDASNLDDLGKSALWDGEPIEQVTAVFLSVPQSQDSPSSLYGIDWDLGDLLPVEYAGKRFDCEVVIVYVSINDRGQENITGRNEVDNSGEQT